MGMAQVATDEETEDTTVPQPSTLDMARGELYCLIKVSLGFQEQINGAKTGAKKNYFKKKLKKNNVNVMRMTKAVEILRSRDGDTSTTE